MAKRRKVGDKKTKGTKPKVEVSKKIEAKNLVEKAPLSFLNNQRMHLILIFLLGFMLYGNTISHDYAQDDAIVITMNDFTQEGFSGIGKILKEDTFLGFFKEKKNLVAGGRYRPLSLVTFAVEYQFTGGSATVSHFINVLLYSLTGVLLYLLLLKLLNPSQQLHRLDAYFIALATTVLFMAHPIHTEAVANIKGRDEIMSFMGSVGAMLLVLQAFYRKSNAYLIGAAIVFFLGLLSKENTVTFLAVIPLGMYFFTKAETKEIVKHTAPLLGVFVLFMIIRASALGEAASLTGAETPQELMNNPFLGMSGGEKLATIFFTLGKYLQLLVFPHPLTHDYYPYKIGVMTFGDPLVLLSLLAYIGMGIYALMGLTKKNPVAFGIIYFIATTSIISNLVFPVGVFMSERFMFMPSLGFCFVLAYFLQKILVRGRKELPQYRAVIIVLGVLFMLYGFKTIFRNGVWKNDYTLFSSDYETSKNSAKLNNAMGGSTIDQALKPDNEPRKVQLLNEAIGYLNKALEIHPNYSQSTQMLGNAYVYLEDYEKASSYYLNTSFKPNQLETNAQFLLQQARDHFDKREMNKALAALNLVLQFDANNAEVYGRMGMIYGSSGNTATAVDMFNKALAIDGTNADAYYNLGITYGQIGDFTNAVNNLQKAVQYDAENANAHQALGFSYEQVGNKTAAQASYQKACALDSKYCK